MAKLKQRLSSLSLLLYHTFFFFPHHDKTAEYNWMNFGLETAYALDENKYFFQTVL